MCKFCVELEVGNKSVVELRTDIESAIEFLPHSEERTHLIELVKEINDAVVIFQEDVWDSQYLEQFRLEAWDMIAEDMGEFDIEWEPLASDPEDDKED